MAEDVQDAYELLIRQARELAVLSSCSALLHWDEQTYMPRGGSPHRGEQMAYLAGLHHEHATDPRFGELLAIVGGSDLVADPESPPAVNVRELRRNYQRKTRLPRNLVEAWPEPPRWPSKSGSRRGARPVLSVSARGWRRLSSSNVRKRPA